MIVPQDAGRGWVLSVQPADDSPDINCSPSYGLQIRAAFNFERDSLSKFSKDLNKLGVIGHHGAPGFPTYIFQGTNDKVVGDVEVTKKLVRHLCGKGTVVQYHQYPGLDHMQTFVNGNTDAWRWILSRFLGIKATECRLPDLNAVIPGPGGGLTQVEDDLAIVDAADAQIPLKADLK
ncbi:hypothetical protein ABOM_004324 [Aspergillus bombycis]|uniref:Secretory lipase n=1 Tax=Aspergillus bombycis TaxID=109264 RepID=A0A1F8A8M3_9EURO|nr:hypothetical protein ABOM_004324 [Aspergillus bombycis]OGM47715.1 hypothetical protein ABOM_004324 [Aspergillus bombycis]